MPKEAARPKAEKIARSDTVRPPASPSDASPFERMRELTAGTSVTVNRALLVNNARVAAALATALAGLTAAT